ncbi:hypothetical protein F5Y19DRAFT_409517 [Xylariaceae sp. FL1651]|nr:hypothetical protein F5Y19DRAFT_409517 [Xylariaceae sp. FL1651]
MLTLPTRSTHLYLDKRILGTFAATYLFYPCCMTVFRLCFFGFFSFFLFFPSIFLQTITLLLVFSSHFKCWQMNSREDQHSSL